MFAAHLPTIKDAELMTYDFLALIMLLGVGSDAPPNVPNFCSRKFCVEVQPMVQEGRKGFVPIDRSLMETEVGSWMNLKYGDLGSISYFGPFSSSKSVNHVSVDTDYNHIRIVSCSADLKNDRCEWYLVAVLDNGLATRPLICSLASFWRTLPIDNSSATQLGRRIDVGSHLAEQCL